MERSFALGLALGLTDSVVWFLMWNQTTEPDSCNWRLSDLLPLVLGAFHILILVGAIPSKGAITPFLCFDILLRLVAFDYGVWVISPQNVTDAGEKDSYLEEQSTLASRARTNFPFTVLNVMQKAAGVEDHRRPQNWSATRAVDDKPCQSAGLVRSCDLLRRKPKKATVAIAQESISLL